MPRSSLDPELFQNVLASAFAVQKSLVDVYWPSAIPEVRRLIAMGALSATGTMHLIAGRARNVAAATGVAIAIVTRDQLTYRAGSGIAAGYVGRHVMATFSVSAKVERRGEILRVEDADTDPRIGGAICRQRGAKSLLILPIYQGEVLSGILEVFFSDRHTFQDEEICLYKLMSDVIAEALAHSAKSLIVPKPVEPSAPPLPALPRHSAPCPGKYAFPQGQDRATDQTEKLSSQRAGNPIMNPTSPANHIPRRHIWKVADRGALVIVLVMASWIAYTYRTPAPARQTSARRKSSFMEPQKQVPSVPGEQTVAKKDMSVPQTASVPTKNGRKAARSAPRRLSVGDEEINYISEDVTVRYFKRKSAPQQEHSGYDQVEHISEDSTARHSPLKPAAVPQKYQADRATAIPSR